jgi:molybdopterin-containing oxidoreductase family iron-sulfur binding subunit
MNNGQVDALIVYDANPVYELPMGKAFSDALGKVATTISFASDMDETAAQCKVVAPANHYLESWGDAEPVRGHVSMIQPTISPLFDTRQRPVNLLKWMGADATMLAAEQPYYEYLKARWSATLGGSVTGWNQLLHDGVFTYTPAASGAAYKDNLASVSSKIIQPGSGPEITFHGNCYHGWRSECK